MRLYFYQYPLIGACCWSWAWGAYWPSHWRVKTVLNLMTCDIGFLSLRVTNHTDFAGILPPGDKRVFFSRLIRHGWERERAERGCSEAVSMLGIQAWPQGRFFLWSQLRAGCGTWEEAWYQGGSFSYANRKQNGRLWPWSCPSRGRMCSVTLIHNSLICRWTSLRTRLFFMNTFSWTWLFFSLTALIRWLFTNLEHILVPGLLGQVCSCCWSCQQFAGRLCEGDQSWWEQQRCWRGFQDPGGGED